MPLEIVALNLFGMLPRPDHFSLFLLGFTYLGIAGARLSTMFAPIISAKENPGPQLLKVVQPMQRALVEV